MKDWIGFTNSMNCRYAYPFQHLSIIHQDFDDPKNTFGLGAIVYHPCGLYFPIPPYKTSQGKLGKLCRTCAEINHPCMHDDKARALTGFWVITEFNKTLKMGKITEIWHFD